MDDFRSAFSDISVFPIGTVSGRLERAEAAGFDWVERAFCFIGRLVGVPFLVAFFAAFAVEVFTRGALDDVADAPRAVLRDAALGEFLRVFLDIRLPFVAFGGSIMDIAGLVLGEPESGRLVGNSYGLGVWLQGFDAPSIGSLIGPLGPNGE